MDELLERQQVAVGTDLDRVVLVVKKTQYPMPYAQAFKIAAGLRLASKQAMKVSGEGIKHWRTRSLLDVYTGVPDLNSQRRSTNMQRYSWSVRFDGEMIYLNLGGHEIGFHFEAALKIAEWLRFAGKKAKRWAGDGGRSMTSMGVLADAEYNYKHGL